VRQHQLRRWPIGLAWTVVCLLLGAAIEHWAQPRDARAQPASSPSIVYVPAEGMMFRTLDGHPIARLARDANGAVLELYDEGDEPATRLGANPLTLPARTPECAPSATNPRKPLTLDNVNPWDDRL
jgi:hypothetical protein